MKTKIIKTNILKSDLMFILYDGRAKFEGTEMSSVIDTTVDELDACKLGLHKYWDTDYIWYEQKISDANVISEIARNDLPPVNRDYQSIMKLLIK